MFKIIGGDQKEYGPCTVEEVRQWIRDGRLDGRSRIRAEGVEVWKTVADCPEFAATLAAQGRPPMPPPMPSVAPPEAKTSALAIASLVLGVLGLLTCGLTALVGLVLGVIALIQIGKSQGRLSGNGLAIGGICVSALFALALPILAAMLLPAFAKARGKAEQIQCVNNVRQLCLAVIMYADGNKGQLPPTNRWCDAISPYLGTSASTRAFRCPTRPDQDCTYSANAQLEGKQLSDLKNPAMTVLVFESNAGRNQAGGPPVTTQNHRGSGCVGFADGHVEVVPAARLDSLIWTP